jgi:hypothetical protein
MTELKNIEDQKKEMQTNVLKSFYEQFATNQNHHQSLFIQIISAVLVVIIGYGIIYANTSSQAKIFDVTRHSDGNIVSYSIVHLIGTYAIAEFILVLLGSLILNIGYSFRRDQKVNFNIRKYYLGEDLYLKMFGDKSFDPTGKKLIFNSFLPGFNLIFVSFIYFLQIILLVSLFVAINNWQNFTFGLWTKIIIYILILLPILLSAKYLHHYFSKYKKTVR